MIENQKHIKAFSYYYSLGDKRTLEAVAERFNIGKRALERWSSVLNWQERVALMDIEVARALKKKDIRAVVATKAQYRREIQNNLKIVKALIGTAVEKLKAGTLDVETAKDLDKAMASFDRLAKLDLTLMGEDPGDQVIKVTVKGEDDE